MSAPVLNARLAAILAEHAPWEPTVALIEQRMTEIDSNPFQVARLTLILEHELKRIADLVQGLPTRADVELVQHNLETLGNHVDDVERHLEWWVGSLVERVDRLEANQDLTPALDASLVKGKIEARLAKVEQRIEDIRAELAS